LLKNSTPFILTSTFFKSIKGSKNRLARLGIKILARKTENRQQKFEYAKVSFTGAPEITKSGNPENLFTSIFA